MVDIAIVGIGCRFPGGVFDPKSYWNFLLDKGDGIVDIPPDRWSIEKYYDPDPDAPGRMYTRRGGLRTPPRWGLVSDQVPHPLHAHSVGVARAGDLLGPTGAGQAVAPVVQVGRGGGVVVGGCGGDFLRHF